MFSRLFEKPEVADAVDLPDDDVSPYSPEDMESARAFDALSPEFKKRFLTFIESETERLTDDDVDATEAIISIRTLRRVRRWFDAECSRSKEVLQYERSDRRRRSA